MGGVERGGGEDTYTAQDCAEKGQREREREEKQERERGEKERAREKTRERDRQTQRLHAKRMGEEGRWGPGVDMYQKIDSDENIQKLTHTHTHTRTRTDAHTHRETQKLHAKRMGGGSRVRGEQIQTPRQRRQECVSE